MKLHLSQSHIAQARQGGPKAKSRPRWLPRLCTAALYVGISAAVFFTILPLRETIAQDSGGRGKAPRTELSGGTLSVEGFDDLRLCKILPNISGKADASECDAAEKIEANLMRVGPGVYYVFKNGIICVFEEKGTGQLYFNYASIPEPLLASKKACPAPSGKTGYLYRTTGKTLVMSLNNFVAKVRYPASLAETEDLEVSESVNAQTGAVQVLVDSPAWGGLRVRVTIATAGIVEIVSKKTGSVVEGWNLAMPGL